MKFNLVWLTTISFVMGHWLFDDTLQWQLKVCYAIMLFVELAGFWGQLRIFANSDEYVRNRIDELVKEDEV